MRRLRLSGGAGGCYSQVQQGGGARSEIEQDQEQANESDGLGVEAGKPHLDKIWCTKGAPDPSLCSLHTGEVALRRREARRDVGASVLTSFFIFSNSCHTTPLRRPDLAEAVLHVLRERLRVLSRREVTSLRVKRGKSADGRGKRGRKRTTAHLRMPAVELQVPVPPRPRLRSGAELVLERREAKRLAQVVLLVVGEGADAACNQF